MIPFLRGFSLAFLAWHAGRLFPGLAEPGFLVLAALAGLAGGSLVRRWRGSLALIAGGLAMAVTALALTSLPVWLAGPQPSFFDTVPLWADRQAPFAVLPFLLGWVEGWAFTGRPQLRAGERLIHAVVAAAVFWSQGPYHVTLYPHPLALALAVGLFLSAELVLLAGSPKGTTSWAATLLVVAAGTGLLWGLLTRYEDQSTASGGGLMKPDLFQFDFAPLVRLEDEITLGDSLVLLYREEGTPRTRYLRRMVLDEYDPQKGFSVAGGKPPAVGRRSQTFAPGQTQERVPVRQEYYLVNIDPSSFLALNAPTSLSPYAQWNQSSFVSAYRVESLVAGDAFWLYNEQLEDGLTSAERELDLRGGQDPEIYALAVAMTAGAVTPYEKASAIALALKENYFYSLKPGAPGSRGALKHFLFEGKKGYCSYFAFSMALLLRSLDIPARIAVGFATNPEETVLGFTPVRSFQAHAWVEVPFGPYGWLEFDPTSETPAPGEPFQFPKASDPQALSKLISEILEAQPVPLAERTESAVDQETSFWVSAWKLSGSAAPWVFLVALVVANEGWRHRWRLARLMARDDRKRASLLWAELVFRARRARLGPNPGETPQAWSERTASALPGLSSVAQQASRARYAREGADLAAAELGREVRPWNRRFDHARPPFHRCLAALWPWWPR